MVNVQYIEIIKNLVDEVFVLILILEHYKVIASSYITCNCVESLGARL